MKLGALFFGDRDFLSPKEIEKIIVKSKNFSGSNELENTDSLLIFETSKQRTWLVASPKRLYCILDDIREVEPNINWSMKKDKLIQNNILAIELKIKDKSNKTGLIDFGPTHKNWLYSKKLFSKIGIVQTVNQFIMNNMA